MIREGIHILGRKFIGDVEADIGIKTIFSTGWKRNDIANENKQGHQIAKDKKMEGIHGRSIKIEA